VLVDGVLIPAWRLVNGVSITQPAVTGVVAYFHIELETHEILLAEGCPVESYLEIGTRGLFENGSEAQGGCGSRGLARVESGFHLAAIRARVARRAGWGTGHRHGSLRGWVDEAGPARVRGWAVDVAQPEVPVVVEVLAGGRMLGRVLANVYRGDLRAARLGGGCHGFELRLPESARGRIGIYRAWDGAEISQDQEQQGRLGGGPDS
jgi:hypothetical protein